MKYLICFGLGLVVAMIVLTGPAWADPWEIQAESGKFYSVKTLPALGSEPKEWGANFTKRDLASRDADYIYKLALDNNGPTQAEKLDAFLEFALTGDKTKVNALKVKLDAVEAAFPKPSPTPSPTPK